MNTLVEAWTEKLPDLRNMFSNSDLRNAKLGNFTVSKALLAIFAVYITSRTLAFFRNLKVNKIQCLPQITTDRLNWTRLLVIYQVIDPYSIHFGLQAYSSRRHGGISG